MLKYLSHATIFIVWAILLYALLYCFEPPLETIQCKLASVNNLCWWLIENNWTWIRATYQLLFDLQHRLIMQKALQFHSLIPWSRALFQFTNFVSWMTSKLFLHKFLIGFGILILSHPPCWFALYGPLMIGSMERVGDPYPCFHPTIAL